MFVLMLSAWRQANSVALKDEGGWFSPCTSLYGLIIIDCASLPARRQSYEAYPTNR